LIAGFDDHIEFGSEAMNSTFPNRSGGSRQVCTRHGNEGSSTGHQFPAGRTHSISVRGHLPDAIPTDAQSFALNDITGVEEAVSPIDDERQQSQKEQGAKQAEDDKSTDALLKGQPDQKSATASQESAKIQ